MAERPEPATAAEAIEQAQALEREIGRALVGQRTVIRELVVALLAAGHVLIEGVPGVGKTLLGRALAAALGGSFSRVQFTPDLMPSDISGHTLFDMRSQSFRVRKGPVFCNVLLADEINRAPAKTQSALLEAMQEQQVTIEGQSFALGAPFLVLATQNPVEQEGTYPLPQAQLDRFLVKVLIDYPSLDEEQAMVRQVTRGAAGDRLRVDQVRRLLEPSLVTALQQQAADLQVDEQIVGYAVRIVRAARDWNGIDLGAGPRGSIALLRAARAHALVQAQTFVTPDDVKAVAPAVLRHRIKLSPDLEIEGYRPDDVLADILGEVNAPRL
jgi:MoxR-like ATPase